MTSPNFDVIVCGSLHLDIVVDSSHLPQLDETVVGSQWRMVCGGKGGNQAVMSARLGARTAMIGSVGRDDFGTKLLSNLQASQVDCAGIKAQESGGSGMSVAIMTAGGDYGAVIVSGTNLAMVPQDCAEQFTALGGARVLILQNEAPEAVNVAMAAEGRRAGAQVIFNAAPARAANPALLDNVDVLVVNRVEAQMMSGLNVADEAGARAALSALSSSTRNVIVTLGGEGLVVQTRDGDVSAFAPHKVTVQSTHGAGDCFIGALASRLASGDALLDACAYANKAAALFVSLPLDLRDKIKDHLEGLHAETY
jgi:ribokinase